MYLNKKLAVLTAALLSAGAANAATVSICMFETNFEGADGGVDVTYVPLVGTAPDSAVSWGGLTSPDASMQSGYEYESGPAFMEDIIPPADSGLFMLGTFTHNNFPIDVGTSITAVNFRYQANVDVDGVDTAVDFLFTFTHEETDNNGICAYGGAGSDCNDRVTISAATTVAAFTVNGVDYTLVIEGFGPDEDSIDNEFITPENASTSTFLFGRLTTDVDEIPEPGSIALLGIGLFGLAALRRRR